MCIRDSPGDEVATPQAGRAEVPWAAAEEDDVEGVVRAVAKDPAEAPVDLEPLVGPVARGEVDLGHLPPVPEVGPDAASERDGDRGEEAWLPETGEVDAWPAPVLASIDGLCAWQVEHRRRRGRDELVVHLALAEGGQLGEVLVALERSIGATQYVVGGEAEVTARVAAAGGRRVVDRRAATDGHGHPPGAAPGRPADLWSD